jgi:sigma-B regulation protein RsbQ
MIDASINQTTVARNNVKVTGRGFQPMLFAHGFGCDQNMWRFVAPAFEDDYKVVLFDYVGSGKSDLSAYDPRRYGNLRGYAQDVVDVCAALDLREVIFVGHSVSSMVGILAAQIAPDRFSKLIMVGPSPRYINAPGYIGGFERADIESLLDMMDKNFIGWARSLAPAIMKNPEHPEYARELEESFCSTDPRIARRFAEVTFFGDNREDLAGVHIQSLIMQCSDDMIAPLSVGDYLRQRIAGSTLRVMKATGHCPHVSHPEETIEVIKEYLQPSGAA